MEKNFKTSTSSLTVLSPSSGEVWLLGKSYNINWSISPSMRPLPSKITISLNVPRPACLDAKPACDIAERIPYNIATNIVDAGSYLFTVPQNLPEYYRGSIEITINRDVPASSGKSDVFIIK
ncbi:MAG: hypothetical protein AAB657_00800 [Patescibacteria group bacterium]